MRIGRRCGGDGSAQGGGRSAGGEGGVRSKLFQVMLEEYMIFVIHLEDVIANVYNWAICYISTYIATIQS